jgi:hypothetical protein
MHLSSVSYVPQAPPISFFSFIPVPGFQLSWNPGTGINTVHPLTAHNSHPALEDGTDTGFRNVGLPKFDAGEIPKRIHTIFNTRRKFEIKISELYIPLCSRKVG